MNKVTVYNTFSLLGVKEFNKEFRGCKLILLLDFFSSYDHVELNVISKDIITFFTLIGLFKIYTLP